jgi:hypothetical protein
VCSRDDDPTQHDLYAERAAVRRGPREPDPEPGSLDDVLGRSTLVARIAAAVYDGEAPPDGWPPIILRGPAERMTRTTTWRQGDRVSSPHHGPGRVAHVESHAWGIQTVAVILDDGRGLVSLGGELDPEQPAVTP